ncbi:MAG: GAF domain-containing protein [candidate division Zixibacteria bacterium]|nr:GAF domain-containing protein [candidate division Zixibacteria bacterium]
MTAQANALTPDADRRLLELKALYEAGRTLSSTSDTSVLLDNILRLAMNVTGAQVASVMLIDSSGKYLTVAAARGFDTDIVHRVRQDMGESISGYVARTAEPLLIENVEKDPRFKRRSHERYGGASLICVPLKIGSRVLGVVNLANKKDGGVFINDDLPLLITFASQAAVVIEDSRQFEEKTRQLAEFQAIHMLSKQMPNVESHNEMRTLVFETLRELIPIEYALWLNYDQEAETMTPNGVEGREFEYNETGEIIIRGTVVGNPLIENVKPSDLDKSDRAELREFVRSALGKIGFPKLDGDAFMVSPVIRDGVVLHIFCAGASYLDDYNQHEKSLTDIIVSQAAIMYEKEKALLNASRLITMGNMISEISHDIRKPLTAIQGSLGLLGKRIEKGEDTADILALVKAEILRLNDLVSELVDFSKPNKYEAEKIDLRTLVMRGLELLSQDLEKGKITSRLSFSEDNWELIVNKNQIFEAMINLISNAIDAMPDGGELTITGKIARPDYKSSDFLAISVTDTGTGISPEKLSSVFGRYYTTKESGSGLGLAVVERVMSAHNGTVSVDSEEGKGTTFTLYFPMQK